MAQTSIKCVEQETKERGAEKNEGGRGRQGNEQCQIMNMFLVIANAPPPHPSPSMLSLQRSHLCCRHQSRGSHAGKVCSIKLADNRRMGGLTERLRCVSYSPICTAHACCRGNISCRQFRYWYLFIGNCHREGATLCVCLSVTLSNSSLRSLSTLSSSFCLYEL